MSVDFELSPLGKIVWEDRYALKDREGNIIEKDISETFQRVAKVIASKEEDSKKWEKKFYDIMAKRLFSPAGRILAHSGTHYPQLLNCFVLPFEKDSLEEIMNTAKNTAIIQKYGGGTGFNYSVLRPSGSYIKGVNGRSCGTIGFLDMMSKVSEIIEQGGCLVADTLINTAQGLLYFNEFIKEKEQGWYPQDLILKTKDGDFRSKQFYVNGYSDIISIETDSGLNIKGTHSHKIHCFTNEGYQWKEFKDIREGDYIVSKLGLHEGTKQNLNNNIKKDHFNCIVPDRLPNEIDEDFAFFLGYYTGNGFACSRDDDYRIGVSIPEKSYLIDQIEDMFKRHFGYNLNVLCIQKPNDKSKTFYISNKIVKNFLSLNGLLKSKSLTVSIPEKVRRSPRHILGHFLAGLFEADGGLSHGYPELNTPSYTLAKEVQVLLFGLGIPCKFYEGAITEDRYSKNAQFYVKVISFLGLKNWNEITPEITESRFNICREHEPDLSREKNYIIPFPIYWLKKAHAELLRKNKIEKDKTNRKNIGKLSKRIKRYLRGDRNLTFSSYQDLVQKEVLNGLIPPLEDCFFSKVVGLHYSEDYTYDMEVPETHSYVANSFISHNSRRGANLGLLEVWHPDTWELISYKNEHNWEHLREFIDVKDEEKWSYFKYENLHKLQMYNVSIGISDEFLEALEKDEVWPLVWEDEEWELYTVSYKKFKPQKPADDPDDYIEKRFEVTANCDDTAIWKLKRIVPYPTAQDKLEVVSRRKIKTSEIWDRICNYAWADGCPGIMNLSRVREMHNMEYVDSAVAPNPCGEQPLPPFGSCNLSSLILVSFVDIEKKEINYPQLKQAVHTAVRFADNVIDICEFPIPEIKKKAHEERRVGLGTMGVHDMLIALGLGYDTEAGRKVVEDVLKFIRDEAYKASIDLAKEKGTFPKYDKDKYMASGFIQTLPENIQNKIKEHGIRNGTLLSQAPTGTIGTMHNVSTGCEPWYSLSYQRNTRLGSYEDGCPAYLKWKEEHDEHESIPDYFTTAPEIAVEDHVKMMALFSKYVDSAVSKTINLPNHATVDDVKKAFLTAMGSGIKGLTIFRDQSKEGVMVSKKIVKEAKKAIDDLQNIKIEECLDTRVSPKKRGNRIEGATYRVHMQNHNLYITANRNKENSLVEVFATVGESKKPNAHHTSGVEDSWAEGLGKIISLALRAGVSPDSIIRNLKNIPSDKPVFTTIGDDGTSELVPSPPHAIARVIEEELKKLNLVEKTENIGKPCDECGSINTIPRSPTCYECLDCFNVTCG